MIKNYDYERIPIVNVVNDIIVEASKKGASDIHFDPQEEYLLVRIRIDGQLMNYTTVPNTLKRNLVTRIKIVAGMNITESRLPQDGAIKTNLEGIALDLRVSSLPTSNGEKIVIRILDYSMSMEGLDNLGFSERNFDKVTKMISAPNGIILVTGATGTGKSTTVYSVLQKLNTEDKNIVTAEDPIEMDIPGVNQVQVNPAIDLTFDYVLRSTLRQDPNIIMIGEIRDTITAKIAVRASITGHLVLSTLHTNDSLNTIERLLDMDVERYLLASSLGGIISQRLARKLCQKCRTKRPTNAYEKETFKKVLNMDVNEVYDVNPNGCPECAKGFKGRIAIHEVLLINQEIRDAISAGIRKEQLRNLVFKSDVTTLIQDGLEKVLKGYTSFEEVIKLIELDDSNFDSDRKEEGMYDLNQAISDVSLKNQKASQNPQNVIQSPQKENA